MSIVSDLKEVSKKYHGHEGVVLEHLIHVLKIWDCWRRGKCDLQRLEDEIRELEEILVAD